MGSSLEFGINFSFKSKGYAFVETKNKLTL
jgi:hypothetical protein